MITSQQPMMLNSALAFERIIKDPKAGMRTVLAFAKLTTAISIISIL